MKLQTNILKGLLLLELIFLIAIVTSCDGNDNEKRQRDMDDFTSYVRGHRDSVDFYATHDWDSLNYEFEERRTILEKDTAKMDEAMRASYNKNISEWEDFRMAYNKTRIDNTEVAEMDRLRATLALEGVRPDYTDLNATNALRQYEHFVNTVRANKDAYTQEQWTVINVNYKALNGRKREIDQEISGEDLRKIARLQLEYTGIKAVNRPFAEDSQ
jgi:hypothetical protein